MAIPKVNTFVRHRGPVTCAAGVKGTSFVATSGYDGAVALCDTEKDEFTLLGYHEHLANSIIVNDDGTLAASSSSDYTIYVWDLVKKECKLVLKGHTDDVESFIFVDNRRGASVSRDASIILWDLDTGEIERQILGHDKDVLSIAHQDGKLFTSGDDMTLRVWDVETGDMLHMWGPFETETDTCAIDPELERVILGCDDGVVRIFDIKSGDILKEIAAHTSGIKKVAVSPINGDILSSAYDQKILIWDAKTFEQKLSLEAHPFKWERSFNWSPDGKRIYAGTFDGTVLIWNSITGKFIKEIGGSGDVKGNACFNEVSVFKDGTMALVSDDGYIRMAELSVDRSGILSRSEPKSGRMLMNAVSYNREMNMVVAGTHNQKVNLYHLKDELLDEGIEVMVDEGPVNCVRVSNHPGFEKNVFVACYSGAIVRISPTGEILNRFFVHENAVKSLRLHPTKPIGASCSADGILVSWDMDGNKLFEFSGHTAIINDIALSPSGALLASVGRDFNLKVYPIEGGDCLYSYSLGQQSLKSVCFVSEELLVVGDYWGDIIRVNLVTGKVDRSTIASNGISSVDYVGDDHIVASSYDGSVRLIEVNNMKVLNQLEAMKQRIT